MDFTGNTQHTELPTCSQESLVDYVVFLSTERWRALARHEEKVNFAAGKIITFSA